MKAHTRRVVAFIVGALASESVPAGVFDSAANKFFAFGGQVDPTSVSVVDAEMNCSISGTGADGRLSLHHYGNNQGIALNVSGESFDGFDHDANHGFQGEIQGATIVIVDPQENASFNYSV